MNQMIKKIVVLILGLACLASCKGIKEDIAELQDRVDTIEAQLKALQDAYDDGKIIKEVTPYDDATNTGWTITFSDNESIVIYDGIDGIDGEDGADGADGITPIVTINELGYWEVSYDNGVTFALILDAEGNPIMSKGDEGLSVRVVVSEAGKYIFETYYASDAEKVVSFVETPYSANPASCINSISQDPYSGVILLTMADGTEYKFNLDVVFPTSIVVLAESVVMPAYGVTTFAFRVNPSNAIVDLNLDQPTPMFQLDMALEEMTRSYVTASENYKLHSVDHAYDANGNIKEGQYLATVRDLGLLSDYCEGAAMVINTLDGKNKPIQISSDLFKIKSPDKPQFTTFAINGSYATGLEEEFISVQLPYGTDLTALRPDFVVSEGTVTVDGQEVLPFTLLDFSTPVEFTISTEDGKIESYYVSVSFSRVPVVYINTKDAAPIVSKSVWLEQTDVYVTNAGEYSEMYSEAQIKGRGNSTWNYPKKPYALKFMSREKVLGMPKHKRWVLLANYVDKTCIRNSLAFEISRRSSGIDWTPRWKHVDLIVNGVFLGNYLLCEQIRVDKNRVNIKEMESTDIDAEKITGGYLLEIDKTFDEVNKFYSPIRNRPVMVKSPDEDILVPEQFEYIKNHITDIENALYAEGGTTEDYLQYIDLDSFIDYWLIYELTSTGEPTHPKSVFMYKDRGGKMHAGPVWDFDYFTFQPYYNTWLINTNAVWNDRIINDPNNRAVIKARWMENRDRYRTIAQEIDRQYEAIRESAEYNATIWPLSMNVNRDDALSVKDAVARIKGYYETKFNYMDTEFSAY